MQRRFQEIRRTLGRCGGAGWGLATTAVVGFIALPHAALAGPDPCTGAGVVTCSGNQSAGVANPPPGTTTLNVNALTRDIAPSTGAPGIALFNSTPNFELALNAIIRPFGIIQLSGTEGIVVQNINKITLSSIGNVSVIPPVGSSIGVGAFAVGFGPIILESVGNISVTGAGSAGLVASAAGATVYLSSTGNISVVGDSAGGIAAISNFGPVNITSRGNISVSGNSGDGILAASGDSIAVLSTGNISVLGSNSFGVHASTFLNGTTIDIKSFGNVFTPGKDSDAIRAESFSGNGAITISLASETIVGGSGSGAGVVLVGGANNLLINSATIVTSAGLKGTAVLGSPFSRVIGNNTVTNTGTIVGNVELGPGRNAFNNLPGGTFDTGAVIKLGASNVLRNTGNLSPGGAGVIQATALTGNLVQGSAGGISVDVNPAIGNADRLNVNGTAVLSGQIFLKPTTAIPTTGTTTSTILHAEGGVSNDGIVLTAPAVAAYQLEFPNANDVVLQGGLDFAPPGLNGNQAAIGRSINAIQLAGGSAAFQPVVDALLTLPDAASLGRAYDQLSPASYADNQIADFYSGLRFADSLMSCKAPDGRYAFIREGQCVWAQIGGGFLDLAATGGDLGFRESAVRISGGAEIMLQPDWFAGLALGYEHGNDTTAGVSAKSQVDRGRAGAVIKYNSGPYLFAAAVYGGFGWYTTDRSMDFGGFDATAAADSRVGVVGGRLRAAYLVDEESWYVKPLLNLNVTHIGLGGFAEHGAGGAGLIVSSSDQTVFSGSPAVEIGAQWLLQEGIFLRPFARVGITAYSNTSFAASALFAGSPAGVAPFQATAAIDRVTADVAVGADLLTNDRWGLKLAYGGHYGARIRSTDFSLKASLRF